MSLSMLAWQNIGSDVIGQNTKYEKMFNAHEQREKR